MPPMAAHPVAAAAAAPTSHAAPVEAVVSAHTSSRPATGSQKALSSSSRGAIRSAASSKSGVKPQPTASSPILAGTSVADDDQDAPGLGFDYAHYAAVHPNAGRHLFGGGSVPFVGGGIFVPYPVYLDNGEASEPAAESAPAEVEQPLEDAVAPPETTPLWSHAHSDVPTEPDSEYVFVRRDGTVFFAIAFTFDNTDLRYVTQDGFRKSVPLASLDLVATQQFNAQRGLSPRLPT